MTDSMIVPNTIRNQMRDGKTTDNEAGFVAMMCWGVDNLTGQGASEDDLGVLTFSVKGMKFKGHVKVRLMFNDTYRVEFWKFRRPTIKDVSGSKMVHAIDDVYAHELTAAIDSYVEHKEVA